MRLRPAIVATTSPGGLGLRGSRLGRLLAIAALVWFGGARVTLAATGVVRATSGSGLTLTCDTRWIDGSGYRPVTIDLAASAPFAADRSLQIEFHASFAYGPTRKTVVKQDIELPAGSMAAKVIISVPQFYPWHSYDLNVFEDGQELKKLSQSTVGFSAWTPDWHEGLPAILVVADKATAAAGGFAPPTVVTTSSTAMILNNPNTDALATLLPVDQQTAVRYGGVTAGQTGLYPLESMLTVPPERLFENWLDYTSLDIVCLSTTSLNELSVAHPRVWKAIRTWVSAGGNLIIYGVGSDFSGLAEAEARLGLLAAKNKTKPAATSADPLARGWAKPNPIDFSSELPPPFGKNPYSSSGVVMTTPAPFGATGAPIPVTTSPSPAGTPVVFPQPSDPVPFLHRRFGQGAVLAVAASDVFAEPVPNWAWMLKTLTPDRWLWYRRHGVSVQRDNDDFWNWLVQGIRLAPVTAFRLLITIFVIAIGPLNYAWLRKHGRLHLLLMVVPLSALAITMGLFGYAIMADGLGVRLRSRTLTEIDQARRDAVCWSRLSYYAGLAPFGGLTFPADVAVAPMAARAAESADTNPRRTIIWSETEQNLASGWLNSRTPTQLMTVRSRPSMLELRVHESAKGVTVENALETTIKYLALVDGRGRAYQGTDIAPRAGGALKASTVKAEVKALLEILRSFTPADPPGMDREAYSNSYTWGRSYYWYGQANSALPGAESTSSRLEKALLEAPDWLQTPRSYVAIVERSPESAAGLENVHHEDSLHVIVGRW